MAELVQANWILLVVALVIGLLVAWWIFVANRRTSVTRDEGADYSGPAKRNQALIDAPPAAAAAPPTARPSPPLGQESTPETAPVEAASVETTPVGPVAVSSAEPDSSAPPAPGADDAETGGDDLSLIKGLGPKLRTQLQEMGISSFAQIAAWDEAEIDRIDAQLGRFRGRIRRDNWVAQAQLLQSGDRAAYEERFGRT